MHTSRLLLRVVIRNPLNFKQFRLGSTNVAQLYGDHLQLNITPTVGKSVKEGNDHQKLTFPYSFLRDHCRCAKCYSEATKQRIFDLQSLRSDLRPTGVFTDGDQLVIEWNDGHKGHFPIEWLCESPKTPVRKSWDKRSWAKGFFPAVTLDSYKTDEGLNTHMNNLITYGISLITGVNPTEEATRAVCQRLCKPQETIFGTYWTFTGGVVDHMDSAYSYEALGAHTDNTYYQHTPGYQVFHCLEHSNGQGGETLLVDGLNCVNRLQQEHPEAFRFLSTTAIPHEYIDDQHHLYAENPVVQLNSRGELLQLRYNSYDRAPLRNLHPEELTNFYSSYKALTEEIRQPDNELWLKLSPGMVLFVDNWRVMHGRSAFKGRRVITGCYLNRDDFYSRARVRKLL